MGQTCSGFAKYRAVYPNRTQCWGDTSKDPTVPRAGRGERRGAPGKIRACLMGTCGANEDYPVQRENKSQRRACESPQVHKMLLQERTVFVVFGASSVLSCSRLPC